MKNCEICGASLLRGPEFVKCLGCGCLRTDYDYDSKIYDKNYAQTYLKYAEGLINTHLNLVRLGLVARFTRICPKPTLMDIGCGVGEFLRFAEPYFECYGVEPNGHASVHVKARVFKTLPPFLKIRFDVVTMFDVIEHLSKPVDFLKTLAKDFVGDRGVVILTTPNAGIFGEDGHHRIPSWKHYKPREHLFLHTNMSIKEMAEVSGFQLVYVGYEESEIRPGNPCHDIMTCVLRKVRP